MLLIIAEALDTQGLMPIIEKAGIVGFLFAICFILLRWLQSTQAEMVKMLRETLEKNTEALARTNVLLTHLQTELECLERRRAAQTIAKRHNPTSDDE